MGSGAETNTDRIEKLEIALGYADRSIEVLSDEVAKLNKAIEAATKNQEYLDLLEGKLLFPSKFVGSAALTADIEATIENLKKIVGVAE